jgi:hypothetical protein
VRKLAVQKCGIIPPFVGAQQLASDLEKMPFNRIMPLFVPIGAVWTRVTSLEGPVDSENAPASPGGVKTVVMSMKESL